MQHQNKEIIYLNNKAYHIKQKDYNAINNHLLILFNNKCK